MATEIERLVVTLEARMGQYEANMRRAQQQTNQALNRMEGRMGQFQRNAERSFQGVGFAAGTLGAYLGAAGVSQVTEYANTWTRLTRALEASQRIFGVTLRSAEDIANLASEARIDMDAYAKLYIRTSAAIRDYGFEADAAEKVTSTLSKALKLGGATAGEQTATLIQFSQALQKGKLDGDEFRTVMENAGVVQELLAERLNVTKGEIIKLAQDGKLGIQDLVGAMTDGAEKVNRIFNSMPVTVDEAFQALNNRITEYVGTMDKAYGISQGYAGAIAFLARNIETAGDSALVLGAALLGAFSPAVLARMWAFAAAATAAQGPMGVMVASVAAAGAAYAAFGDDIRPIPGQMADLHDVTAALAEVTGDRLAPAWETAKTAAQSLAEVLVGTSREIGAAASQTEGVIFSMLSAVAKAQAYVLRITGLGNALSEVAQVAEQNNIAKGFVASTTVSRPRSASIAGNASSAASAKLSAYEKEVRDIIRRTNALEAEAKVIGKSAFEMEKARAARELLTAAEETAKKTGVAVTAAQIADIQQMSEKYAQLAAQVEYLRAMQISQDNIKALQDEVKLLGLTGSALTYAKTQQELYNAARLAGVAPDEDRIARIARETAALQQQIDVFNTMRDKSKDALKGFIDDLRQGKTGVEALGGVLDKLADKLIDMAADNLVNAALGGLTNGGSSGGFNLASLFGFAKGGIAANGRPVGLPRFARGGVSNTAAIFGEAGPEAAIPLPDGRTVPVTLSMPDLVKAANSQPSSISVNTNVNVEKGDEVAVHRLIGELPKVIERQVNEMMSRNRLKR